MKHSLSIPLWHVQVIMVSSNTRDSTVKNGVLCLERNTERKWGECSRRLFSFHQVNEVQLGGGGGEVRL